MKPFAYGVLSVLSFIAAVCGLLYWFLEREKKNYLGGRR